MADVYISETDSELLFGPFSDDCVYHLEDSKLYKDNFRKNGAKSCEFVLLKDNTFYFIEAKKSCPNYFNASEDEEKREKYREYVSEISQKMLDSLSIFTSILLSCNKAEELPDKMKASDLSEYAIRFVLVVKTAESSWLEPYPAVFQSKLRKEMNIWNIPSFIVWTEERASRRGLVSKDQKVEILAAT